jgi:acyl-CoA thioesterase-1
MSSVFLRIFLLFVIYIGLSISHANAKDSISILLFGDSIVAGYELSEEESLHTKVEENLRNEGYDVRVINGGVSGDTTTSGLNRLEWVLDSENPDLVVLALGGNDVMRGTSPDLVKKNVDAMLDIIKDRGINVILSEVEAPLNYGIKYKRTFDEIYEDLADDYDVPLYPFLLKETFGKPVLMKGDQIHPTARGIEVIAEDLSEYLIDEYLD